MSHARAQSAQGRELLVLAQHDLLVQVGLLEVPELLLLPEHMHFAVEEAAHHRETFDIELGEGLAALAEQEKSPSPAILDQWIDGDLLEIVLLKMLGKLFQGLPHPRPAENACLAVTP